MARPFLGGTSAGVVSVDAAKTMAKSDTGKTFMVTDTGSAGYAITLPTPANAGVGICYKFINNCTAGATLSNSGGEDVVISDGQSDLMVVHYVDHDSDVTDDDAADSIAFDHTSVKGDYIELFTDGTTWFAYASSGVDGGILVAT